MCDDELMAASSQIYLLHGKGGRPTGSVLQLEEQLRPSLPGFEFHRPSLAHGDPEVLAEDSLARLPELQIPQSAFVVGVSLGGLVAAKLQESSRPDLRVICISSPTWADGVRVERKMPNRVAFYSSHDDVIQGRTADWPKLAEAYDLSWLTHDTDLHKDRLAKLIVAWIDGENLAYVIKALQITRAAR